MERDYEGNIDRIPYDIEDDLGELSASIKECPGVYFVVGRPEGLIAPEYYIAAADTPCLSAKAKEYGKPLPHHSDLLQYRMDEDTGGWRIVRYECLRYRAAHHLIRDEDESLHSAAVYAMELHPEYFSAFPAPVITPRGFLTRYASIIPGVFAIETDQCEILVAVCYPVWSGELSEYVLQFAEQTEYDLRQGIHNTMGYLFFPKAACCLVLFELGIGHREVLDSQLIDVPALMNAVWQQYPDYALQHNMRELSGRSDGLSAFLRWMGADIKLPSSGKNLLSIIEGTKETEYLKF